MSFLSDFSRYLKTRTDAPVDFHVHAGMGALATALGNRVWCDGWSRDVYPNLWIVLVAPSGFGKSVPPDIAVTLLQKAQLGDFILPNSFSYEALVEMLQKQPVGLFEIQELSAFTGMLGRDYMSGTTQFLTEVYDCPPEIKRMLKSSGETRVTKPCISILAATSPKWFGEAFKSKDLEGGFYARFLFCPSFESGAYVGMPGPRNEGVEASLADHLRAVAQTRGKYDFAAARPMLNAWDRDWRARARKECPPEFSGMRSRAGLMVLKAAMLFTASEQPGSLAVTKRDAQRAIDYIEHTQTIAEKWLTEEVAQSPDEADRIKILDNLRRAGGRQDWSAALRQSRMTAFKFKNAVETLEQAGKLTVVHGNGKRSRATSYLVLGAVLTRPVAVS